MTKVDLNNFLALIPSTTWVLALYAVSVGLILLVALGSAVCHLTTLGSTESQSEQDVARRNLTEALQFSVMAPVWPIFLAFLWGMTILRGFSRYTNTTASLEKAKDMVRSMWVKKEVTPEEGALSWPEKTSRPPRRAPAISWGPEWRRAG